jgi:hypothetical protein
LSAAALFGPWAFGPYTWLPERWVAEMMVAAAGGEESGQTVFLQAQQISGRVFLSSVVAAWLVAVFGARLAGWLEARSVRSLSEFSLSGSEPCLS